MPGTLNHTAMTEVLDGVEYLVRRNVPIFDEHENNSAPVPFNLVTRELLVEIAAANNARQLDTGDSSLVSIQHNAENRDPPVIGFARNFGVADGYGRLRPRSVLTADLYIESRFRDEANSHPRRSIELWPDSKIIDPICLLGSEMPQRDLGPVKFHRTQHGQGQPLRYQLNDEQLPETDESRLMDALSRMPFFNELQSMMEKLKSMLDSTEIENHTSTQDYTSSITNNSDDQQKSFEVPDIENTQADDGSIHYQQKIHSLQRKIAELRNVNDTHFYEKQLDMLANDGFKFDRCHLIKFGIKYGKEVFNESVKHVRLYGGRDIENLLPPASGPIGIGGEAKGESVKYQKDYQVKHKARMLQLMDEKKMSILHASEQASIDIQNGIC